MELLDKTLFEDEIIALEQKIDSNENSDNIIAFYGSSSIRLWDSLPQNMTPMNVINLGFGGSSYPYCVNYFERVFAKLKPSQLVLYAGDNDLGNDHSPEQVLQNFSLLVDLIQKQFPNALIHVISIKPSPSREYLQQTIEQTNKLLRDKITNTRNGYWIDVYSKMLTPENTPNPSLYVEDMLHLNEKGYDIWRKEIRKHLISL
ncbi:GDSL-type esterase/lipase family protein [Reichenbachiella sp. MALMAid0571]|uniref:GDSL-type esterase/lipase family protein n=1 Tax=Reichenbachiella sp. MALMAid0571 TaxID=3143939 RepID=UPI0032DFC199